VYYLYKKIYTLKIENIIMTYYKTSFRNINKIKNQIIPNNIVVCYYYTDTCPYCIMIKGLMKEITDLYKDNKKVILISINRNHMEYLNENMQIDLVPTFITYKYGKRIAEFRKKREYENIINFINKYENK